MQAVLMGAALKVVLFIAFALFIVAMSRVALNAALRATAPPQVATPAAQSVAPATPDEALHPARMDTYGGANSIDPPAAVAPPQPSAAEIRESKRKADEAMKVIEQSTPEM